MASTTRRNFVASFIGYFSLIIASAVTFVRGNALKDSYIITLKSEVDQASFSTHTAWVAEIHSASVSMTNKNIGGLSRVFNVAGFKGYSGAFDSATLESIKRNKLVASIEQNFVAEPQACQAQITNLPWNLVRISRLKSISGGGPPPYAYYYNDGPYPCCSGGTWAYILDTGITVCHTDLEGRAYNGLKVNPSWPDGDTCGHGTHVTGTIIGRKYGVMKTARAVGVKVMGGAAGASCAGTLDGVMAGVEWAYKDAVGKKRLSCSVINMSLAVAQRVEAFNKMVNSVIAGGLTVVVAAGNGYPVGTPVDACTFSPGGSGRTITVGATEINDSRAPYSNFGPCITVFAPGSGIKSSYGTSCTATFNSAGTSMASPLVAGWILYAKSLYCYKTPEEDRAGLLRFAVNGVVINPGPGSPNRLVNNRGCPASPP